MPRCNELVAGGVYTLLLPAPQRPLAPATPSSPSRPLPRDLCPDGGVRLRARALVRADLPVMIALSSLQCHFAQSALCCRPKLRARYGE